MKPIQEREYVELTGTIRLDPRATPRPFILLMGPKGEFLYRVGSHLQFSDGATRGIIDYDKYPAEVTVIREGVDSEDVAMAVAMTQGPYPFACARVRKGSKWTEIAFVPGPPVYTCEGSAKDKLEIIVRDAERDHRFTFSGASLAPVSYEVTARSGVIATMVRVEFSIVRFPASVPEATFRPDQLRSSSKTATH